MIQITIALVGVFVFTLTFAAAIYSIEETYGKTLRSDDKDSKSKN
jgi:hypothetical protein|tara:strand:- start:1815 stop:1949 length:135 start_codon:yes stop_codon:yes gene_type:complete